MNLERKYENLEYNVKYIKIRTDSETTFLLKLCPMPSQSVKTLPKKPITISILNNFPVRLLQRQDTKTNSRVCTEYCLPPNTLNSKNQK